MSNEKTEGWLPKREDMKGGVTAAKRIHVQRTDETSEWEWWVGFGKDESCQIEGPPNHWFWLAYILLGFVDAKDAPYSEDKPLPHPPEAYRDGPRLAAENAELRKALEAINEMQCSCVSDCGGCSVPMKRIAREVLDAK